MSGKYYNAVECSKYVLNEELFGFVKSYLKDDPKLCCECIHCGVNMNGSFDDMGYCKLKRQEFKW